MLERSNFYYQLIFKKLFNIASEILEQFQCLMALEKQNKKDSLEYQQGMLKLIELIKEEESYYSLLQSDKTLIGILIRKLAYFNKNSNDFIIPKSDNSKIYTRMSLLLDKELCSSYEGKSIEIFSLFNKLNVYSLLHFETTILALILFRLYITRKNTLDFLFMENLYSRSYMFPYVGEITLANNLDVPESLYSLIEVYRKKTNVTSYDISAYKERKAEQIITFLNKNTTRTVNYVFLLFYLKALSSSSWQELISKCAIPVDDKITLEDYLTKENADVLVRTIKI